MKNNNTALISIGIILLLLMFVTSAGCIKTIVGGGPGHLAIALAPLSDLTVYALDNAKPMEKIAVSNVDNYRLGRRVKPFFGDVHAIPFGDASLDLVVSRDSFFLWENLPRGLSKCRRVLKPGGMAYIGSGFGNTRLRDEIMVRMHEVDPVWKERQLSWYANSNPHMVRTALAAPGIFEYELIDDESGYWICFGK